MGSRKDIFKRLSQKYRTPYQVQKFLRTFPYNREFKGETLRSAWGALKHRTAHCLEAAFLAAAILEHRGYEPLVLSLESKDNLDHVIFVFRTKSGWGAIGRSREEGLHGRSPVFRSLRQLANSYFDPFIDKTGKLTGYGLANLNEARGDWRHSRLNVWAVEKFLIDLPHKRLPRSHARYSKWYKIYLETGEAGRRQSHWW